MIFLDSNVFLRYLVQPTTPELQAMAETARTLFAAVKRGDQEVTTTEVVLHEVDYVLASKAHYNLPAADIVAALKLILLMPSFTLPRGQKRLYLRALDLYAAYPKLGLADAIIAARVEHDEIPLATFDRHFSALPNITVWQSTIGK